MIDQVQFSDERWLEFWASYKGLPHQKKAVALLGKQIKAADPCVLSESSEWVADYKTSPAPSATKISAAGIALIKKFEGCRLTAYKCPAGVLTIGFGSTGPHVTPGKTISQAEADALLAGDLERFEVGVNRLVKVQISQGLRDALISFAFNLGVGALEESTLLRRLNAGEEQCKVVREELPKWCKAGSQVLEGLQKRRAAEIELACPGSAPAKASKSNPLKVQYQSQNDNKSGTGYRECFSSSCAMLAMYWGKVANDDQYNLVRAKYGDSTSAEAQLAALRHLGLKADFYTDGTAASLEAEINAGRPVAVGWLHHGSRNNPTGGGHWSVVTNHSPTSWIQNDPNGEADLVNGGYTPNLNGAGVVYSRGNWNPRWMVGGSGGWYLRCRP